MGLWPMAGPEGDDGDVFASLYRSAARDGDEAYAGQYRDRSTVRSAIAKGVFDGMDTMLDTNGVTVMLNKNQDRTQGCTHATIRADEAHHNGGAATSTKGRGFALRCSHVQVRGVKALNDKGIGERVKDGKRRCRLLSEKRRREVDDADDVS